MMEEIKMINGNVDNSYQFPENEKGMYHVGMDRRIPKGGMEFEDIHMVQKFIPREYDRFEANIAVVGAFFNRKVLHDPTKKITGSDYYKGKTRVQLMDFVVSKGESPAMNIAKDKLIALYDSLI